MAKEVVLLKKDMKSHRKLYAWINETLVCKVCRMEDLRTGAIYCQLIHRLFPKTMPISKICFLTSLEIDYDSNFKLLESAFDKLDIKRQVPVFDLKSGRGHYEFTNWMYKFYITNDNRQPYDALAARKNSPIGLDRNQIKFNLGRSSSLVSMPELRSRRFVRKKSAALLKSRKSSKKLQEYEPAANFCYNYYREESMAAELPPESDSDELELAYNESAQLRQQVTEMSRQLEEIAQIILRESSPEPGMLKIKAVLKLDVDNKTLSNERK